MLQVKNHLLLLAGDDCHFLRKCGSRGLGEWTVDFEGMTQYLQEVEMDTMLLENFGKVGHRLARMMRKLGKLDEKQLPNLALVKQKDARTKLAEMQMAGVVDIQEVPRDSGRTTSRTIFLWYFDVERVSTILLDSIYKNMSRCFQRLDIERRRVQDVLALTERTDLLDEKPEKYMDQEQLNTLHEIEDKEESILGHIGRLDELVAIFRDY
jgi:DNA-directed RNA polymerase III subunit RPC3